MALIASSFLPQFATSNIATAEKTKYQSPLPATFIPSKQDQSANYLKVKELEEEFGFQYSSAIGMLIFLINTTSVLQYAIHKLAKFTALPGRLHFKALIHLLHHIRTHCTEMGIRFYSPDEQPAIHRLVHSVEPTFDFTMNPVIVFTDSSWQDCPDTSRSTGCYLIYLFGSLVDAASFVPNPIALSSAEAEYNACAFALTAALHVKQVYNKMNKLHPDAPLTIPMFVDSSSAIAMMNNDKDTKRTRHIQRRIHFVRQARIQGILKPYKIDGKINPSDVGTKNLPSCELVTHRTNLHVQVAV